MKLRGSKTEKDFRDQLIESHRSLFGSGNDRRLFRILNELYPQMITAYVIHWIPEQRRDFYRILINDDTVAKIELDHDNEREPIVESATIPQYLLGLSRINQVQLAVAIDLAMKDMENSK